MAWDVEGTKRKIIDAATQEFTVRGPDGTTMERIAKAAGVNKERVYNYFGSKSDLFEVVLREKLAMIAQTVRVESYTPEGIAEYAGKLFDYNCQHPELVRLVLWESLSFRRTCPRNSNAATRMPKGRERLLRLKLPEPSKATSPPIT
jgi:AcrR family transcriptional regulator